MTLAINGGDPVRSKFLSFSMPDVHEEDIEAAVQVMRTGWLSTGKKATEFEDSFSDYKNVSGTVALSSCTAALHLALETLGLPPKMEVLVPNFTFSATVSTVFHAGLRPVIVDCEPYTMNISLEDAEKKITPKTRAMVIVHFAGLSCDMDEVIAFCNAHNLLLIEDCAHAIETTWKGQHAGTFGRAGCFSFYGTKNITTACGEGGALITNHRDTYDRVRTLSLHGMSKNAASRFSTAGFKHYDILEPGYKYNMPDVSAAFLSSQLKRIDYNWSIRKSIWDRYKAAFSDLPIGLPVEAPDHSRQAYHLFVINLYKSAFFNVSRDQILDALTKEGIGVGVHYRPIHLMSFYKELMRLDPINFPNSNYLASGVMSLPLTASMSSTDVDDVIAATRKVLTYYKR
jgi:dTDP-4-amino-4,6-dideoxygalactose transaminase